MMNPTTPGVVQVLMLGGFELRVGDRTMGDQDNRSHQVWRVLEYLVAFRHREITQNEMIEAFWPDEQSDNPANALKNLIYRIRVLLTKAELPNAKDIIVFSGGAYSWNNRLATVVDSEEFEALIKHADDETLVAEVRVEQYLAALHLYRGDFLGAAATEAWAAPLTAYFHSLYMRSVHRAAALLQDLGRNNEIVQICRSAAVIDQFDEGIHAALLRALARMKKPQLAIEHYQQVVSTFYNELGVKPSAELKGIYREIVQDISHVETSLDAIKEELVEGNVSRGAFVCEYEIFKDVYRLIARSAARNGRATFIALLTATTMGSGAPSPKAITKGMDPLLCSACAELRRGDVVTRFSPTQYLLLLPALTFENGQSVTQRIIQNFRRGNPRSPLMITANLQPVDLIND